MNVFAKHPILDVWQSSKYASGLFKLFCSGSKRYTGKRLIHTKLIIVFILNLGFFPYSEVIHGRTTFKLTKVNKGERKIISCSIWCFGSFFFFILTLKCHKQKWHMLIFTPIKWWCVCWHVRVQSLASNQEDCSLCKVPLV